MNLRKSKLGIVVSLLSIFLLVTLAGCAKKESPAPAENQPAESKKKQIRNSC